MAVEIVPVLSRDVFATYGYFVVDGDAKQAILIDPGAQPGLTVFPNGNPQRLRESIEKNIFALPDETMLLSGHSLPLSVADLKARMRG